MREKCCSTMAAEGDNMKLKQAFRGTAVAIGLAVTGCQTQQSSITPSPTTEGDDIVGIVAGPKGPEAGVWVIAETNELPTKYTKIVVTDEHGRFAIPDLPWVRYSVWVRGYGLVDSRRCRRRRGARSTCTRAATRAPGRRRRFIRRCTGSCCSRCRRRVSF